MKHLTTMKKLLMPLPLTGWCSITRARSRKPSVPDYGWYTWPHPIPISSGMNPAHNTSVMRGPRN